MERNIAEKLISLNYQFYQSFASQFSATRQYIQPGIKTILSKLGADERVLDIGCGNGRIWNALVQQKHRGKYIGLDFSSEILKQAVTETAAKHPITDFLASPVFKLIDLKEDDWWKRISVDSFDAILAFAVFHHIPGDDLRSNTILQIRQLLSPKGKFYIYVWQFLNRPRLAERIQDWSIIGLQSDEVDPGDYLLDWRRGGTGYRYIHHFSAEELHTLARQHDFQVLESFSADGAEGNLGLYQVWKPNK